MVSRGETRIMLLRTRTQRDHNHRMINRRRFLELSSTAALGWSLARCTGDKPQTTAPIGQRKWGEPRADQLAAMVPKHQRPDGVLEVFLLGGLCPWDTFYVVPEYGDPNRGGPHANTQWWTFQGDKDMSPAALFEKCGGGVAWSNACIPLGSLHRDVIRG